MSIVDAAGYAMAPTDDLMSCTSELPLEAALRNGHQSAARAALPVRREPSMLSLHAEAWALWVRDLFGFGGRAAA